MIALGAELDQFYEISGGLRAGVRSPDAAKRAPKRYLGERVKVRSPRTRDLDFGFEKQIELAGKRTFWPPRAFGNRLDTAERLRAPRDDQAGVAELALSQE